MNGVAFTRKNLDALGLPEPGRRDFYYDDKVRGLALVVYPSGRKKFVFYRWIHKRPERVLIGPYPDLSIEQARGAASDLNAKIARGENPADKRRVLKTESTLEEAFQLYLDLHAKPKNKTWQDDEDQLRRYLNWDNPVSRWKLAKLSTVREVDIQELHSRVGRENGPYAANRLLALLRSLFNKAIKWGWEGPNPAIGVEKFREHERERILEPDELPRFFAALETGEPENGTLLTKIARREARRKQAFSDYIKLSLFTGARRSNVLAMRWEQINLPALTWTIPDTKAGDPLRVTLSPEAIDILRRRREVVNGEWVFPSEASRKSKTGHLVEPKGAWRKLLEQAEIKNVRLHDLRRTFGSFQAASGASLLIIGKSLGHKSQASTKIYARLNLDPVRASVSTATRAISAAAAVRQPVTTAQPEKEASRRKQAQRG
jgi:integrase